MKKLLLVFSVLIGTSFGQVAARFDLGGPIAGVTTTSSVNGSNYLIALPGVRLNWCSYPANSIQGTPCTNYSPTYTSTALTTTCPSNQPIVLQNSNVCQGTSDNYGNLGVFYDASVAIHSYTLTYGSKTYGPFIYGPGGSGGGAGSGGAPNQSVSFFSAFSASLQLSGSSPNITWDCWDNDSPANGISPDTVTVSSAFVVTFTFVQPQSGYCSVNSSSGSGNGPIGGISGVTTLNGTGLIGGASSGTANLSLLNTCLQSQVLAWDTVNGWGCVNQSGGGGGGGPLSPGPGYAVVSSPTVGLAPINQVKPAIDVRDYNVVGNGFTDDTTAMQAAATAACNTAGAGQQLIAPANFAIKVSTTIAFTKCSGVHLNFGQSQGAATIPNSSGFIWAGAAGGTVLLVNQTRDSSFENFFVKTQTGTGANNANVGIDIDEQGAVTNITTNNIFRNVAVQSLDANTNLAAIRMGQSAPGNVDAQTFEHITVLCSSATPTTSSSNGSGLLTVFGSSQPNGLKVDGYAFTNCSKAINLNAPTDVEIFDTGLFASNYNDVALTFGSGVVLRDARTENAIANQIEIGSNVVSLTVDNWSFGGLTAATKTINYQSTTGGTRLAVRNSRWDNTAVTAIQGPTGANSAYLTVENTVFPSTFSLNPLLWSGGYSVCTSGYAVGQNCNSTASIVNPTNKLTSFGIGALAAFTDTATTDGFTAFGYQALNAVATVHDAVGGETAFGYQALQNTNAVGYNEGSTAVGYQALMSLTNQGESTAVGYQAGKNDTGGNNTSFGYKAGMGAFGSYTGNENIAIGFLPLSVLTTGSNNVAIADGAAQFATTGSFNIALGGQALRNITTSNCNIAIGYQSLLALTSTNISGTGTCAAAGGFNIGMGARTLSANTTGVANIAIGHNALSSETVSAGMLGIGYNTLLIYAAGGSNSGDTACVGGESCEQMQGGSVMNTALGADALQGSTTPYTISGATAIGMFAGGKSIATGADGNIFLGMAAGYNHTTGPGNIIIGTEVDAPVLTGSGQLNIGNVLYGTGIFSSIAQTSDFPTGNSSTPQSTGRIGIDVTSPAASLDIGGEGTLNVKVSATTPVLTVSSIATVKGSGLSILSGAASGSPTLIASGTATLGVTDPVTINTTGATLFVAVLSAYNAAPTISDGQNNSWHYLTTHSLSNAAFERIAYAYGVTTSGSHTFTVAGVASMAIVYAFSGTPSTSSVFDVDNGAGPLASPFQTGSITPTAGDIVVTGFGDNSSVTVATINSGFNTAIVQANGCCETGAASYLIGASGSALNPTWTVTGADTQSQVSIASFKSNASGNQSSPPESFTGAYWDGAASQPDTWTATNVIGTGTTPTSTLTVAHAGSPGAAVISFPSTSTVADNISGLFGSQMTHSTAVCETAGAPTTLSGASTNTGLTCLPANAIIDSVVYRITTTITTAANFTIGDGTIATRFCGTQSTMTAGTTGICFAQADQTGTSGPRQVSAAAVKITPNTTPGAGAIRLIVFYHTWTAPTS